MDKDIEILQDWITRDRQMRNNSTESDYDKFCEEKCKAIESLICKIADLEAKLAESKQETNDWKQRFESSEERFKIFNSNGVTALNLKNEKIEKLKQQLAETDKLMQEYLSKCLNLEQQLAEKEKSTISILEKVKDWLNIPFDENGCFKDCKDLENYIDQQIAKLKGEK